MSRRRPSVRVLFLLAALAAPSEAAPASKAALPRPLKRYDAAVLDAVRVRAARRLRNPECRKVLSDFTDVEGRTLEERLRPWGMEPSEYLLSLPFFDGSQAPLCRRPAVQLVTTPGLVPILVCPARGRIESRIARVEARHPSLAEVMVIHEMLHTLGLGEDPPTTFAITDRVRARCR
jgi:hypothetical protein